MVERCCDHTQHQSLLEHLVAECTPVSVVSSIVILPLLLVSPNSLLERMAVNIPSRDTESSNFRLLIGAMTWGEGELESEIQAGFWFITDARDLTLHHLRDQSEAECDNGIGDENTDDTYSSNWSLEHSNRLWKKIMREMGSEYTTMARLPISIIRPT